MRIRFTSAAELDLKRAIEFYDAAQKGLGFELLCEVKDAKKRIQSNPLAWPKFSPRTRRCRTHRFPYALFYQVRPDEIVVLSVVDLRSDPSRWEQYV